MMTKTEYDETYIFKIRFFFIFLLASKFRFFFRVSFIIEPGRSLLQFVTTNCLIYGYNLLRPILFLGKYLALHRM